MAPRVVRGVAGMAIVDKGRPDRWEGSDQPGCLVCVPDVPCPRHGWQVGWEELTEAAMTQLLRSALARSAKDSAAAVPPLTPGTDIARLKRHVSLVFDRLGKGMCLNGQGPSDGGSGGEVV